eukprot:TRINITY_DN27085_c0_g1_i1.p1 TRINITY_DN27085_c0_g1~~TRINITY_DN27085_c0_g1_i1.p1  ORF type:complete len:843 (+),score=100.95 TRINITY_DN27085_c0_g1_i1:41-2530(+)
MKPLDGTRRENAIKALVSSTGLGCQNILITDLNSVVGKQWRKFVWTVPLTQRRDDTVCVLEIRKAVHLGQQGTIRLDIVPSTASACPQRCVISTSPYAAFGFVSISHWSIPRPNTEPPDTIAVTIPAEQVQRFLQLSFSGCHDNGATHRICRMSVTQEATIGLDSTSTPSGTWNTSVRESAPHYSSCGKTPQRAAHSHFDVSYESPSQLDCTLDVCEETTAGDEPSYLIELARLTEEEERLRLREHELLQKEHALAQALRAEDQALGLECGRPGDAVTALRHLVEMKQELTEQQRDLAGREAVLIQQEEELRLREAEVWRKLAQIPLSCGPSPFSTGERNPQRLDSVRSGQLTTQEALPVVSRNLAPYYPPYGDTQNQLAVPSPAIPTPASSVCLAPVQLHLSNVSPLTGVRTASPVESESSCSTCYCDEEADEDTMLENPSSKNSPAAQVPNPASDPHEIAPVSPAAASSPASRRLARLSPSPVSDSARPANVFNDDPRAARASPAVPVSAYSQPESFGGLLQANRPEMREDTETVSRCFPVPPSPHVDPAPRQLNFSDERRGGRSTRPLAPLEPNLPCNSFSEKKPASPKLSLPDPQKPPYTEDLQFKPFRMQGHHVVTEQVSPKALAPPEIPTAIEQQPLKPGSTRERKSSAGSQAERAESGSRRGGTLKSPERSRPSHHRKEKQIDPVSCVDALLRGTAVTKYHYKKANRKAPRILKLIEQPQRYIGWCKPGSSIGPFSRIHVADILDIQYGAASQTFLKVLTSETVPAAHCITVVGRKRTLDVEFESAEECRIWVLGLQHEARASRTSQRPLYTYASLLNEGGR